MAAGTESSRCPDLNADDYGREVDGSGSFRTSGLLLRKSNLPCPRVGAAKARAPSSACQRATPGEGPMLGIAIMLGIRGPSQPGNALAGERKNVE